MSGFVSIVGAGPGDPDLLTRKAARALAEADLVLYDALVSPGALALAPRAQRFFVGKRAGLAATDQETIHRLMIRAARRGKRVVRLKGGDPFVLGRGGEEGLALAGEIAHFTGISDPYEAPVAPDVRVRTDRESVDESLQKIVSALEDRGLLAPARVEERAS